MDAPSGSKIRTTRAAKNSVKGFSVKHRTKLFFLEDGVENSKGTVMKIAKLSFPAPLIVLMGWNGSKQSHLDKV